jgi:predicted type IV restriction endonuclease
MVNNFLIEVLGYHELEEVKTEYAIKGTYADYVVQIGRKKHFITEVKAIQLDLCEKHLRQAINYAANEGIDWVLLTNGRCYELYRVVFGKPITHRKICGFDLSDKEQLKQSVDCFVYLTRKNAVSNVLERFWKRFQALEPTHLAKYLYSLDIVRFLRRSLKRDVKLLFPEEDIYDSLHLVIANKIEILKPNFNALKRIRLKKTQAEHQRTADRPPMMTGERASQQIA